MFERPFLVGLVFEKANGYFFIFSSSFIDIFDWLLPSLPEQGRKLSTLDVKFILKKKKIDFQFSSRPAPDSTYPCFMRQLSTILIYCFLLKEYNM